MALKAGIVGLPNVGKSTLFNCLSSAKAQAANFPFCTIDAQMGQVSVPDERLTKLAELVHPGRIVPAVCDIVDIAGLVKGASKGEGLGNQFLGNIRECDAIIHVLRCFDNGNIVHVDGSVNPVRDKEIIDTELQLKDLETIENRIKRVEKVAKVGGDKQAKLEYDVLLQYKGALEQGKSARTVTFESEDEQQAAKNLFLLTAKPVLYVCNVDDTSAAHGNAHVDAVREAIKDENAELLISAHYDTAATIGIPDLRIPRNFPVYILSQGAVLLGMLLISLLIGTAVGLATKSGDWLILTFFFAYLALMLLMMFGAANKHNVNDNTSGIAALLETMQRLSPEVREKTAFILFDHQETGSRGAKSYGAQHVEVQTMKLLVDLNCVGDGDTFVISAPKMAQDKPEYAAVRESLEENAMASGVSTQFFGRAGVQGAGDYRRFVCGVGVSAYHHSAGVGLITGRIHTSCDTVCRQENLDYLAKSLADAAQKMNDL